jgi:hypothetical protein
VSTRGLRSDLPRQLSRMKILVRGTDSTPRSSDLLWIGRPRVRSPPLRALGLHWRRDVAMPLARPGPAQVRVVPAARPRESAAARSCAVCSARHWFLHTGSLLSALGYVKVRLPTTGLATQCGTLALPTTRRGTGTRHAPVGCCTCPFFDTLSESRLVSLGMA